MLALQFASAVKTDEPRSSVPRQARMLGDTSHGAACGAARGGVTCWVWVMPAANCWSKNWGYKVREAALGSSAQKLNASERTHNK